MPGHHDAQAVALREAQRAFLPGGLLAVGDDLLELLGRELGDRIARPAPPKASSALLVAPLGQVVRLGLLERQLPVLVRIGGRELSAAGNFFIYALSLASLFCSWATAGWAQAPTSRTTTTIRLI